MKKTELRKLISQYKESIEKQKKGSGMKLSEKIREIEHRYFHETGRTIKSDLKDF